VYPIAIAVAACGFGAVSVLAKLGTDAGAAPGPLFAARMIVAGLLLSPVALKRADRSAACSIRLPVAAGLAFAAAALCEFQALARLPASVLVTIVFASPIWIAVASWALGLRGPRPAALGLFALVAVGLVLVVSAPTGPALDEVGVGLALTASCLFAAVFLVLEAILPRMSSPTAIGRTTVTAAVCAASVHGAGAIHTLAEPATRGYAGAVGVLTAASMLLLGLGMDRTPAFQAAVITGLEPVAAGLLAVMLLGETISLVQALGGLLVVGGVTGVARANAG
jgi:drug/metabolite transporter (DMT)-like permease